MAEPDIRVRVGVEGGASIDQGSGAHIRKDLQKIAATISAQKKVRVSVFLNDNGAGARLQKDLSLVAKTLKLEVSTIDISGAKMVGTPEGPLPGDAGSGNSGGSGGGQKRQKNADHTLKNARYALGQINKVQKAIDKLKASSDIAMSFNFNGETHSRNTIETKRKELVDDLKSWEHNPNEMSVDEKVKFEQKIASLNTLISKYNDLYAIKEKNASIANKKQSVLDEWKNALGDEKSSDFETAYENAKNAIEQIRTCETVAGEALKHAADTAIKTYADAIEALNNGNGKTDKNSFVKTMSKSADTMKSSIEASLNMLPDGEKKITKFKEEYDAFVKKLRDFAQDAEKAMTPEFKEKILLDLADLRKFVQKERQALNNEAYKKDVNERIKIARDGFDGDKSSALYENTVAFENEINTILEKYNDTSELISREEKTRISDLITHIRQKAQEYKKGAEEARRDAQVTEESQAKAKSMLASFNQYLTTVNPKGLEKFATQINLISNLLKDETVGSVKKADTAIKELKASMKDAGYEGGNLFTYLGQKIKTFATYLISSKLTNLVTESMHKMVANVVELDGALTDLRIVTGGTRSETEDLLKSYNKLAQQLGTTTAVVAAGATDWLRQGYNEADSAELLKQSMTLSIVGDMEATEATNALTAALKGYQLQVEDTAAVVDKFFTVDMMAATSSADLATALAKTAANAKLAGMSLDDVIGHLAVVNETMRESGEETGVFYNTMLSRIGAIKSGRLEDPESGESLSDVETTLNGLGIALRDQSGQFRNFGEVLDEVGGQWEEYSNTQQRAIAAAFAGTRMQTKFLSLMAGYKQAGEYALEAANSAGAASEKLAVYQESIEAKSAKMAAAFEGFSQSVVPTELIGGLYDIGTILINIGTTLDGLIGTVVATVVALVSLNTAFKMIKGNGIIATIKKTGQDLGWPEMTGDVIVPIHIKKAA